MARLIGVIFLLQPAISVASDISIPTTAATTSTTTRSILETEQKDEKKEELRKQLNNTIEVVDALANKIQNLARRVAEREDILASQGEISDNAREQLDAKQEKLGGLLASIDDRVNNNLPEIAETLIGARKPTRIAKNFKQEANKTKAEIVAAHKLIIEIINLIKKETQ